MKRTSEFVLGQIRVARNLWGDFGSLALRGLVDLLELNHFSITGGELLLMDGRWYVTHTGLIRLSCRKRCCGIKVQPVTTFCDPSTGRYGFRATVYKSPECKGFVGY